MVSKLTSEQQIDIIAKIIFGEAGSEGGDNIVLKEESLKAIASVLRNRSLISGRSIYAEATKEDKNRIPQFSTYAPTNSGLGINDKLYWSTIVPNDIRVSPKAWAMAQAMARQAIDGTIQDNTGGATHFYNPKKAKPYWAPKLRETKTILNHVFLLDPTSTNEYADVKLQKKLKEISINKELKTDTFASVVPLEKPIIEQPKTQTNPSLDIQQKIQKPSNVFIGTKEQVKIQEQNYPLQSFAAKATERLQSGNASPRLRKAFDAWATGLTTEQKEVVKDYLPKDLKTSTLQPTGGKFLNLIVDKFKKKEVAKNEHDQWYSSLAPEGQKVINKYFGGKSQSRPKSHQPQSNESYNEDYNLRIIKPVYDVPENILNKKVENRDFNNFKEWV